MILEMREPTYLILVALAGSRLHGYGVIREAEQLSDGTIRLRPGTLYATLDRLVGEGVVEVDGEEVVNGRLRRYYRLTATGAEALATESKRRLSLSNEALTRLRPVLGFAP